MSKRKTRVLAWAASIVLAVAGGAAAGIGPASADPHADNKWCDTDLDPGLTVFNQIGYPYDSSSLPAYGNEMQLWSDGRHAVTYGEAYLQKGDYLSIDQTNARVNLPDSTHYRFFSTDGLAANLGNSNFTWTYCEQIHSAEPFGDSTWYSGQAPADGWYQTRYVDGAHRGVRLCVTKPSISAQAVCVGDRGQNGGLGWYADNDDDPAKIILAGSTTPDQSGSPQETASRTEFQANTGSLWNRESGGHTYDTGYGMMAHTSPSTSQGQVAFQANTGFLFTEGVSGAFHDTRLGMMAGTSPALSGGQIAFQANTGFLYTRNMATAATQNLELGMMAGTSPAIAGDSSSWRIAFQANTGSLWYRDSSGATVDTGYGMMAGTSPSITKLANGNYVMAFQANTGFLWTVTGTRTGSDMRLGMMTGTSPSISANGNAWTAAFQANDGFLYTRSSGGTTTNTEFGMMYGTSPAIHGTKIAFQANTGFLYIKDGSAQAVDTAYGMMAGTSPAL
ncbi:MAG TPA: hypothetical protein VGD29_23415 [Actinoplanes sp.]|jgi:hypothetical protein